MIKMTIEIPKKFEKYVVLGEKEEKIKKFECPICDFETKQGPGALRMHLVLNSDPSIKSRYDEEHKEASRKEPIYNLEAVRELSVFPHESVNPKEQ